MGMQNHTHDQRPPSYRPAAQAGLLLAVVTGSAVTR